jgi:energy-coupling factor transporter ATP-binding protein EcfA2
MDVFHERKRRGRTVVLVTHDMATVRSLCDRAMLMHDGELRFIGEAEDAALRYFRLNFEQPDPSSAGMLVPDYNVEVVHAAVDAQPGAPLELDVRFEARRDFEGGDIDVQLRNHEHVVVHSFRLPLQGSLRAGEAFALQGRIENRLVPGLYTLDCWVERRESNGKAMQALRVLEFEIEGPSTGDGIVLLDTDVRLSRG